MNNFNNSNKDNDKNSVIRFKLGLTLHKNFYIHLMILLLTNLIVGAIVIGLSSRLYPLLSIVSIKSFIIVISLFTIFEVVSKLIMVRFLYKLIFITFGLLFFIFNALSFHLVSLMITDFSFLYDGNNVFIFTISFMLIRLLFTTYIRKSKWIQGGI
ncbi:hypothetical protein [Acholeplasma granularum]|uniref:hypothetical protein n=1 Tax=Acholeplasma granularum TaxID=264635 RepID=UPI00047127B1|nr:hypothetical protein [Acholeplasma granularum]